MAACAVVCPGVYITNKCPANGVVAQAAGARVVTFWGAVAVQAGI